MMEEGKRRIEGIRVKENLLGNERKEDLSVEAREGNAIIKEHSRGSDLS